MMQFFSLSENGQLSVKKQLTSTNIRTFTVRKFYLVFFFLDFHTASLNFCPKTIPLKLNLEFYNILTKFLEVVLMTSKADRRVTTYMYKKN